MRGLFYCILVLAAFLAHPGQAQIVPIRVAVEDGTGGGGGAATVAQLNDDTFFDFQATLVNTFDIDTALELSAYDVVILGGTGHDNADWTTTMISELRFWVITGGGLVGTGWINFDIRSGDPTASDLEFLLPGQNIPSTNEFTGITGAINILDNTHPVTFGLSNFTPGASNIEVNRFAPESNDTVLANIVGAPNDIAIAVKSVGSGRSLYLGSIYMASTSYSTGTLRTGVPDQLLEQGVAWAADGIGIIPEPSTYGLVLGALAGFIFLYRRRTV